METRTQRIFVKSSQISRDSGMNLFNPRALVDGMFLREALYQSDAQWCCWPWRSAVADLGKEVADVMCSREQQEPPDKENRDLHSPRGPDIPLPT